MELVSVQQKVKEVSERWLKISDDSLSKAQRLMAKGVFREVEAVRCYSLTADTISSCPSSSIDDIWNSKDTYPHLGEAVKYRGKPWCQVQIAALIEDFLELTSFEMNDKQKLFAAGEIIRAYPLLYFRDVKLAFRMAIGGVFGPFYGRVG